MVGSATYQRLIENNDVTEKDAAVITCDYSKASVPTKYIKDTKRIKQLQKKAILSFYLRPRIFFRLLFENISLSQIKELAGILNTYIFRK